MKTFLYRVVVLSFLFAPAVSNAQSMAPLNERDALSFVRSCTPDNAAQKLTTSTTGAVYSSQLDLGVVYYFSCNTDTHISFGANKLKPTSLSMKYPAVMFPFRVTENARYLGFLADAYAGECWLVACR